MYQTEKKAMNIISLAATNWHNSRQHYNQRMSKMNIYILLFILHSFNAISTFAEETTNYDKICRGIEEAAKFAKTDQWKRLLKFNKDKTFKDVGMWQQTFELVEKYLNYCDFLRENNIKRREGKSSSEEEFDLIAVKPEFGDSNGNKMTIREAMPKIIEGYNSSYENRDNHDIKLKLTGKIDVKFHNLDKCILIGVCKDIRDALKYAKMDEWKLLRDYNAAMTPIEFGEKFKFEECKKGFECIERFLNYCDFLSEKNRKSTKDDYSSDVKELELFSVKPEFEDSKGHKMTIREAMPKIISVFAKSLSANTDIQEKLAQIKNEKQKKKHGVKKIFNKKYIKALLHGKKKENANADTQEEISSMPDIKFINLSECLLHLSEQNFQFVQKCSRYFIFLREYNRISTQDNDYSKKESELIDVKPKFGDSNRNELKKLLQHTKDEPKIYHRICNGIEDVSEYAKTEQWQKLKPFNTQIRQQELGTNYEKFTIPFESIERFITYCDFLHEKENESAKENYHSEDELELIATNPEFEDSKRNKMTIREAMTKIVAAYEHTNMPKMDEEPTAIPDIEFSNLSKCNLVNVFASEYKKNRKICTDLEETSEFAKTFDWQKLSKYNKPITPYEFGEKIENCKNGFECVERYLKYCGQKRKSIKDETGLELNALEPEHEDPMIKISKMLAAIDGKEKNAIPDTDEEIIDMSNLTDCLKNYFKKQQSAEKFLLNVKKKQLSSLSLY